MATRARLGYVLSDDSIVSVYHHWDGYPEWLGNILNKHYNEDEKVRELIDGGNMSSCYTNTDDETGEIVEPHVNYYGGDDEAPKHFQTLSKHFKQCFNILNNSHKILINELCFYS